jgi:hypothetical protein
MAWRKACSIRSLLVAAPVALLAGCIGVSHYGISVNVENDCGKEIVFVMDGGPPPASPKTTPVRLGAGAVTKSGVIAENTGGYIWITSPEQSGPVTFESPPSGQAVNIKVLGGSCEAAVVLSAGVSGRHGVIHALPARAAYEILLLGIASRT